MARKYSCGQLLPSSCIPYTGKDLKFLTPETQIDCDANLDEVIDEVSIAIDKLQKAVDVTTYDFKCLGTLPSPTIAKISQVQTNKLCALEASLNALTTQFNNFNVGAELVTIDLGSLGGSVSACQVSANTYSLISILNLYKNEILSIKAELGI